MPTPVDVASSKVQILNAPILAPGVCMLCGSSRNDDRDYIDIGKDIQFVGVIYFCTFCMSEIANALGFLSPDQTKSLENELESARQRILEFEIKDRVLNDAINALRATGLFSDSNSPVAGSISSTADEQESTSRPQDYVQRELDFDGIDQESKQSDSKQGPFDLSATGDDEFGFGSL